MRRNLVKGKSGDVKRVQGCRGTISLSVSSLSMDGSLTLWVYGFYSVTWGSNVICLRLWSLSFGLETVSLIPPTPSLMCHRDQYQVRGSLHPILLDSRLK